MRDRVCSVFVLLGCLCLTVRLQAQFSQVTESSSQSPVRPTSLPYAAVPFTAEYKITIVQTKADGTSVSSQQIEINSSDSHGRRLFKWAQVSSGRADYTVDDPVAGIRVVWNTRIRQAKVLNYPQPVPGRESCWKVPPEELDVARGDAQLGWQGATCPPAERAHIPYLCKMSSKAVSTNEVLPVITASYPTCARAHPGKNLEELGTQIILGFEAQGCRTTETVSRGTKVSEAWYVELVMGDRRADFPMRSLDEYPIFTNQTYKRTRELTLLRLNEPDINTFQPPKDYEIRKVEMHEVPCERLMPSAVGSAR